MNKPDKIPYVQCVGGRYQFRRRIPDDVRHAFNGKSERVITLIARDQQDVKSLAFQLASAFDQEDFVPTGSTAPYSHTYYAFFDGLTVSAVPEPGTFAMLLAGLGLIGFVMRRKHGIGMTA